MTVMHAVVAGREGLGGIKVDSVALRKLQTLGPNCVVLPAGAAIVTTAGNPADGADWATSTPKPSNNTLKASDIRKISWPCMMPAAEPIEM